MTYFNEFGQARLGWNVGTPSSGGGSTVDTDAQAFITAANITDSTQQSAINTLVTQLKTYGIWAKMKALYPFVGGTASSHKFNLKDPRDLDAAYRLVFNGGWTHSSTGAKPNGTTAYADTKLNPLTHLTGYSQHVSNYSRTQNTSVSGVQIGCFDGTSEISLYQYFNSVSLKGGSSYTYPTRAAKSNNTNTLGLAINNIIASNDRKLYFNGNILDANTNNETLTRPNKVLYLGASNFNTTISQFTPHEHAFDSIGDGLTDTEATNFYTAVQTFQTTLGRQVGVPIVADSDAQAFLNAAVITDSTQANAINTLVTSLKSANIWTKMKAIYPFVGGTASSHKFNLKDPRDLNAAFRLVFNGGWTHSSTGALPNGTNAWANTYFTEYTNITNNDTQLSNFSHASLYSRTNLPSISTYGGIGVDNSQDGYGFFMINAKRADGLSYGAARGTQFTTGTNIPDSRGLFLINRQSNSLLKYSRNNSLISQNTNNISSGASRISFYLGAANNWGSAAYFDNKEHAFVTLGYSLTDAEATAFYNAVQTFQTTLGRQI